MITSQRVKRAEMLINRQVLNSQWFAKWFTLRKIQENKYEYNTGAGTEMFSSVEEFENKYNTKNIIVLFEKT